MFLGRQVLSESGVGVGGGWQIVSQKGGFDFREIARSLFGLHHLDGHQPGNEGCDGKSGGQSCPKTGFFGAKRQRSCPAWALNLKGGRDDWSHHAPSLQGLFTCGTQTFTDVIGELTRARFKASRDPTTEPVGGR